jgi:hydroxymethylbilane synthase
MADKIVLGTRGSDLALVQARLVESALRSRWAEVTIETTVVTTRGDEREDRGKGDFGIIDIRGGRKGLFTGTIERALAARRIDLAVHSAKDLPSDLVPGTQIAATLPRAEVGDVLISAGGYTLQSLPADGIVATGSVRRKHQIRWKRPDLEIVDVKGNVPTRLRKMATGEWHALILARAGLERLGLAAGNGRISFEGKEFSAEPLPREIFLPAGGQGVIAVQIRSGDDRVRMLVESISDFDTRICLRAEREFLRLLHGDCNQPVGVLATLNASVMKMSAQVFDLEATTPREATIDGPGEDAEPLAAELLQRIYAQ